MKSCLPFILLWVFSFTVQAYTFKKYHVNNGLSENTVQVITQDHLGFMWFGTKDGLNRFDGHEYQIYKNIPGDTASLGNNFVRSIYQDEAHNLWIGTDNYIYIFDYFTERFRPFLVESDLGAVVHSGITAICPENDSLLWIGSMRQGAFCYNKRTGELRQYVSEQKPHTLQSNVVWRIFRDYSGTIWLGTREGLSRYNRETNGFYTYTTKNSQGTLYNDDILSIYEDRDGRLWVGTWSGGLARLNKNSGTFDSYLNASSPPFVSHIRAINEYDKATLMIGADDGLYLVDKRTGESLRMDNPRDFNSLSDQNVYSIYRDHEDGIWIGTYFGGVNYMPSNANIIEHYYPNFADNSLSGKAISQFCEDESGNLWIATEDAGLNYFDIKTKKFKVYLPRKGSNSLSYHNLHALVLDREHLWIGTFSRGINVLDLKTGLFENYVHDKSDTTSINDDCVFAVYKDSKDDIYIGTPYGLCRYNRKHNNFVRIPEVPAFVYDIKEDRLGYLWIASYSDGAYRLDYNTGIWKNYAYIPDNKKGIAFNKLTCVYPDQKQRLWFASEGGGICKYNYETDDFTTFNEQDGLPNNVVYSILDDKYGNIWISSNSGISKLNPETKEITSYKKEDGLQGNQFNYRSGYKSKEGLFYFGGINGFNVFDPDKLTQNKHIPPVAISLFEILSEESPLKLPIKDRIELKYDQASFRIKFVSLSFQAQEKNHYVYKMEGLTDKWTNIGNQRTVSFINLHPGKYVFRVKGSNNDGVWNEKGAAIEIIVHPPFWKSTMAHFIYLFVALFLIYLSVRYVKQRVSEKEQRNMERINKEKEKEIYDSKINFFTNIAHEIRTPVSLIKAPLECIIESEDGNKDTKGNLAVIARNTDRLLELINQLLDFRKIEDQNYHLNLTGIQLNNLLEDICFRFRPAAESQGIRISLERPPAELRAKVDKEALTKIISNLLTNALKHAAKNISVHLLETTAENTPCFEIRIIDDGKGIPDNLKERIFEPFFQIENSENINNTTGTGIGLALTRQLTEGHKGKIFVEDAPGGGSAFIVRIPRGDHEPVAEKEMLAENSAETDLKSHAEGKAVILIAEDNDDLRNFLLNHLSGAYQVLAAANGKEGLNLLETNAVDLVISDIVMPETDGLELAASIKQNEQFSHIPVILLSAKTNTQTKVEGLEYGADAYLEKPFSIAFLKAQISSLIENRKKILEKFSRSPFISYGTIAHNKKDEDFLDKINKVIEQNLADEDFSVEKLAAAMLMSQSNLQRKIKGISAMVPGDYIRVIKLKKAAELLKSGKYRVNEICYLVGFGSPSYFAKCFQKQFGILPKDFVKGKLKA